MEGERAETHPPDVKTSVGQLFRMLASIQVALWILVVLEVLKFVLW